MPIIRNRGVPIFDPKEPENQPEFFTFAPLPPREREPSSTVSQLIEPQDDLRSATEKHSEDAFFTPSPSREFETESLSFTTAVTESQTSAKSSVLPTSEPEPETPTTTTTTAKPTTTARFRFALSRRNRTTLRPSAKTGATIVVVNNSSNTDTTTEKSKGNRVRFPPRIRFVQKSDRFVRQNPVDIDIMDLLKFSTLHENSGFELVFEPEVSSSEVEEVTDRPEDSHPETNLVSDPEFHHSMDSIHSWESFKMSQNREDSKQMKHTSKNDDVDTISHWSIDGLGVDGTTSQSESSLPKNGLSEFIQLAASESSPEKSHVITSSPVSLLLPESVS